MLLKRRPTSKRDFKKIPKEFRHESAEAMFRKHESRQQSRYQQRPSVVSFVIKRPTSTTQYVPKNCAKIPLGMHSDESQFIKNCINNRIRNWSTPEPTFFKSRIESESNGPYSSRCRFIKYTHTRRIESWGFFISKNHIYVRIDTEDGIVSKVCKAPRGWRWELDSHGIKITKLSNPKIEIHPTATDFLRIAKQYRSGMTQIFQAAKELYRQRQLLKKTKRAERDLNRSIRVAEKQGMRVCIVDSLRAGNCYGGTTAFALKNKLKKHLHYPPTMIYQLLQKTGDNRIKNALIYALNRHEKEMRQGFACLSDHVLNSRFQ
jgi:hypothetical protein